MNSPCPRAEDALLGIGNAGHCAECAEAFKVHALLGKATLPAPSPAALERASAPIIAELRKPPRNAWAVRAIAAVAGFAAPVLFSRHLDAEGWSAAILVLAAAAALAATAGALEAGGMVVLAASAGFAFAEGGVPGFSQAAIDPGLGCLATELFAAVLPLGAAVWMSRKSFRPGALAQAAAAGALAGQAALNLVCGARSEAPHLWAFHVSGVAAAALVGWLLEGRLYPSRAAS